MPTGDFDGDGRSDILWIGTYPGYPHALAVTNWLGTANGSFIDNASHAYANLNAWDSFDFAAMGDFNGDGRTDVLWLIDDYSYETGFSSANGDVNPFRTGLWFDGAMRPVATGDFNGDGADDILWRGADGSLGRWNGSTNVLGNQQLTAMQSVSLAWSVAGTGDFNGDGKADILWRHANGDIGVWWGTASGAFIVADGAALRPVSLDWTVAGTGDFNGDGRDDILWRRSDGALGTWTATAAGDFQANDGSALIAVSTDWHVAGTGDYNGDGRDDILWRHTNGTVGDWLSLAGGGFAVNNASITVVENGWQIQHGPVGSGPGLWDY